MWLRAPPSGLRKGEALPQLPRLSLDTQGRTNALIPSTPMDKAAALPLRQRLFTHQHTSRNEVVREFMQQGKAVEEPGDGRDEETTRSLFTWAAVMSAAKRWRNKVAARRRNQLGFAYEVMIDLDAQRMTAVKRVFDANDGELTLPKFIDVMRDNLRNRRYLKEPGKLVKGLCQLFAEIDVDYDCNVSWEEFTLYMIQAGQLYRQQNSHVSDLQQYRCVDKFRTELDIERIHCFDQCDHLKNRLFICSRDHNAYVVDAESGRVLQTLERHKNMVMCADYITSTRQVVTASMDMCVVAWNFNSSTRQFAPRHRMKTSAAVMSLCVCELDNRLYGGRVDGAIVIWNLVNWEVDQVLYHHNDMVTCMVRPVDSSYLVSADARGSVVFYDVDQKLCVRRLSDDNATACKGISCMVFSEAFRSVFTGGTSRHIVAWSLDTRSFLSRMPGHVAEVVQLAILGRQQFLLSVDSFGYFKTWDLTTHQCVQTFSTGDRSLHGIQFFALSSKWRVYAGNRSVHVFDIDKVSAPRATATAAVSCACYSPVTATIATGSETNVVLWDAVNGKKLTTFYAMICDGELTAMQIHPSGRKLFTGDTFGRIRSYKHNSGVFLKQLKSHDDEVSCMQYLTSRNWIVSISRDGKFIAQTEESAIFIIADVAMKADPEHMQMIECSSALLLATRRRIALVDLASQRLRHRITPKYASRSSVTAAATSAVDAAVDEAVDAAGSVDACTITCVTALADDLPLILVATLDGAMHLHTLPPMPVCESGVFSWLNLCKGFEAVAVTAAVYHDASRRLYTGDEKGEIKIWRLDRVIRRIRRGFQRQSTRFLLIQRDVRLLHRWHAHSGDVTDLMLIANPDILVSTGADARVRSWSRRGRFYGTLHKGPITGSTVKEWRVPFDEERFEREVAAQMDGVMTDMYVDKAADAAATHHRNHHTSQQHRSPLSANVVPASHARLLAEDDVLARVQADARAEVEAEADAAAWRMPRLARYHSTAKRLDRTASMRSMVSQQQQMQRERRLQRSRSSTYAVAAVAQAYAEHPVYQRLTRRTNPKLAAAQRSMTQLANLQRELKQMKKHHSTMLARHSSGKSLDLRSLRSRTPRLQRASTLALIPGARAAVQLRSTPSLTRLRFQLDNTGNGSNDDDDNEDVDDPDNAVTRAVRRRHAMRHSSGSSGSIGSSTKDSTGNDSAGDESDDSVTDDEHDYSVDGYNDDADIKHADDRVDAGAGTDGNSDDDEAGEDSDEDAQDSDGDVVDAVLPTRVFDPSRVPLKSALRKTSSAVIKQDFSVLRSKSTTEFARLTVPGGVFHRSGTHGRLVALDQASSEFSSRLGRATSVVAFAPATRH